MTSRYDYMRQASLFTMNGLPDPSFENVPATAANSGKPPFLAWILHVYRSFRRKEAIQSR